MEKMKLFAGPCMLESRELAHEVAQELVGIMQDFQSSIEFCFKSSFDKANRSSLDSFRGPGMADGLKLFAEIKEKFNIPVLTDIHLPDQAAPVAEVVDVVQIPAFLCRQTDLIVAAAEACKKHDRVLKIKKGQFLSPYEVKNIVEKTAHFLDKKNILITERGTLFGYQNLIVDMAGFDIIKSFGVKVIHDATHSAQRPGGDGKTTGGKPEQILSVGKAALAAGADGIFMECHPDPTKALSDASTQVPLKKVKSIVQSFLHIYKANQEVLNNATT